MKVGDKLYCKKDFYRDDKHFGISKLTKGRWYEITSMPIQNSMVYVSCDGGGNCVRFYDTSVYFYTEKELRQIKLEKINWVY